MKIFLIILIFFFHNSYAQIPGKNPHPQTALSCCNGNLSQIVFNYYENGDLSSTPQQITVNCGGSITILQGSRITPTFNNPCLPSCPEIPHVDLQNTTQGASVLSNADINTITNFQFTSCASFLLTVKVHCAGNVNGTAHMMRTAHARYISMFSALVPFPAAIILS